jgi:hypothetical protein
VNKYEILSKFVDDIKPRYLLAWTLCRNMTDPLFDQKIMKKAREFLYRKLVRKRKKWGLYWKEKTYLWSVVSRYADEMKEVMRYEIKINPKYNIYQYDLLDCASQLHYFGIKWIELPEEILTIIKKNEK